MSYIVKPGDSLSKIAYKNNVSLKDLIDANPQIKNPNIIGIGQKINIPANSNTPKPTSSKEFHVINRGDNLGKIANMYGTTVEDILKNNNIPNPNVIYVGQKIVLPNNIRHINEDSDWYKVKNILENKSQTSLEDLRSLEQKLSNEDAIKASVQTGNYIIIDKNNKKLTVYNKHDRPIYTTSDVSFGASGNDYNTITYVKDNGYIKSGEGNMSTPAGITAISDIGTYHGVPSYIRSRVGNNLQMKEGDNVASSIHLGNTKNKHSSNGCVRASKKVLTDLKKYVTIGTKIYTLPEREGSKFILRDGNLSFTADDPYGNKIKKSDREKYWYQYNTINNREYSPVSISTINSDGSEHSDNMEIAAKVLQNSKQELQQSLNISSQHYNKLARIALGILEQENQFATNWKYKVKSKLSDDNIYNLKVAKNLLTNALDVLTFNKPSVKNPFKTSHRSIGPGSIKYDELHDELKSLYAKHGITRDNLKNLDTATRATLITLAHVYNTEVRGRRFVGKEGVELDPYDVLLYKYHGGDMNKTLSAGNAKPENNEYVQNITNYSNRFKFTL